MNNDDDRRRSNKIPELSTWDVDQRTWAATKCELVATAQNYDMDTIIDAAQAIADHIQSQYDSLRSTASPGLGSDKPKIKTSISEFSDTELKMMMGKACHGNIIQLVTILKLGYFNRELMRDWSQPKTFRLKEDENGTAALATIHNIAQGKQL
eukprot:2061512-Rhodomonas_salina.1